jgi:hypothetical protein
LVSLPYRPFSAIYTIYSVGKLEQRFPSEGDEHGDGGGIYGDRSDKRDATSDYLSALE